MADDLLPKLVAMLLTDNEGERANAALKIKRHMETHDIAPDAIQVRPKTGDLAAAQLRSLEHGVHEQAALAFEIEVLRSFVSARVLEIVRHQSDKFRDEVRDWRDRNGGGDRPSFTQARGRPGWVK